jgi:hypothetical protein
MASGMSSRAAAWWWRADLGPPLRPTRTDHLSWATAASTLGPEGPQRLLSGLPRTVACGVVANRPYVYFRPEHNETDHVSAAVEARLIAVGVVRSKYLAPFPKGDERAAQDHEELAAAFRTANGQYLVDPDTPALCDTGLHDEDVERRLRMTDAAQAVGLPLTLATLQDAGRRTHFVNQNVGMQAGAAGVVAPYLEVLRERDPRLALSLEMLRNTFTAVSDGRPVVAVLQTTGHRLRSGLVQKVAPLYAGTGVKRLLLRIRRLEPEEATADDVAAYLDAVASLTALNVRVIPDCVGRLGPVLVADGAHAFGTGSRFFRKVAESPINTGGGNGGGDLKYEVPGRLRAVAVSARRSASVPHCAFPGCAAESSILDNAAVRLHNLHALNGVAQLAARLGPVGFAAHLENGGGERERDWARALRERASRAA